MHAPVPLIATLAAAFALSLLLGFVAVRLKLPALVGYLAAGIVLGPTTPGYVADMKLAAELSEIGVMLLMFGVGLHFSLDDLMAVRRIALPGAALQIAVATAMGAAVAMAWGWDLGGALVFGLALSVASTVVLLKALEARGLLETHNGRIAVGWLVVEDLVMVLVLVLLPALAPLLGGAEADAGHGGGGEPLWLSLVRTLLAVSAFVALMLLVGRRFFPWLMWQVARTGSRELFTLGVIAAAVSIAFGAAELFGVSFALGAFFAGMVLRESALSHRAAHESLPLRDAFAVLFFVSVGMLFDPAVVLQQPLALLAVVAIIVLGKSLAAAVLVVLLRYPLGTALTVSASLAQIGEFSFILAGLGAQLKLLPAEGQSLILSGALISIALNPLVFSAIEPVLRWLRRRPGLLQRLERRDDPLAELPMDTAHHYLEKQVVLVGHGRTGAHIAQALREANVPCVVADSNREIVERLRAAGTPAVCGDAAEEGTLIQAHVARARMLVIAVPAAVDVLPMVEIARLLNPDIEVVLRGHDADEAGFMQRAQAGTVFTAEDALARVMSTHVLQRLAQAH
ncbi:YbaL family putative K(+) efflux transporter [uncultured Azohydromonas sp.]|jgi:Kef-type K+ transport system, predicted NAD-binding component|uniref:YbaL family putative K(+) efflux transporter n=1 Tax=uncultured Azohydromonas sp. TaxID=487342 RepID=UPI002617F868|nr:YbaL family putative K(+) efflux transporter [uncultured Azohydromonas sp.]